MKYHILIIVVIFSDFIVMMSTMVMIMPLSDTYLLLSGMNLEWESSSISITGEYGVRLA